MAKLLLLLAASISLIALSRCHPTGAPQETCQSFSPSHDDHKAQKGESKYNIIIDPSSLSSGGKTKVTIQGIRGEKFKGFFIQGRDENSRPVGKFNVANQADAQAVHCSGAGSSDSATHTDAQDKTKVTLEWQAPASFKGRVVFRAAIVKTYKIFWDNLLSSPLTIN